MRKTLLTIGLGLALSGVTTFFSPAANAGPVMWHGHVPAVVSGLQPQGRLSATKDLNLAIGLPLRNAETLANLLQQLYDPASPNFHHYLTPEQFTAQFAPTEQDYQAVIDFARASGLTVTGTHSNRTLVDVSGKVADIERVFHVQMRTYQHPREARQFFAPDVEPTLDASLPILSICGLNNYVLARPLYHDNSSRGKSFDHFATGSSPSGSYWGYDFRNAYAPGVTLSGAGQSVALFECDGYFASDVSLYLAACGLPGVTLNNVLIDGFSGQPSGDGGEIEVALDIDMANSMAPGLSQIIVYEGPNDTPAFNLDILNRIATDNLAKQISSSWLIDDTPQFAQIYEQFAVQGQSFFQASGDSGAYYPGIFQFEDSPLVTLVGGTTLTSTGSGGGWASETVWNNGYDPIAKHEWASGGGISSVYSIPPWQTNINMTANKGSTTMRNIPDVALTADNIYIWADGAPFSDEGGTSAAAPLWAGFMALVNQQTALNGKSPIGFINPAIYSLAQGVTYTNLFHDIVTGNNTSPFSPSLFYAVPGYDLCTGLGTPNGANLINALAATNSGGFTNPITHISPPPPPYGTKLAALSGGNPNGTWELFVQDNVLFDSGTNYNGWILTLTTANPVGQSADLALGPPAYSVTVAPGSNYTFSITITNCGPSTSSNVIVQDILPNGFQYVAATPSATTVNDLLVTWALGNFNPNTGAQLTVTAKAPSYAQNGLQNYASPSSDTPDPNPADGSAIVYVSVGATQLSGSFVSASGTFHLTVNGQSGQEYIVQASTNLFLWVPVYTNFSSFTYIDSGASNYFDRFYRVVTGP